MNFTEKITKIQNKLEEVNKKTKIYTISRLITFITMFLFLILANTFSPFLIIISFISLITFIIIVYKHNTHEEVLKNLRNKITVLKNYELRMNNQFHTFVNTGEKYLDEDKFYLSDLDIFGEASLFQLINVAETKIGQDKLAFRLQSNTDEYLNDITCVDELKDKLDLSIDFQASNYGYSRDTSKVSLESGLSELKNTFKLNILIDILLPIFLIILTISSIVFSIIYNNITYLIADLFLNSIIAITYSLIRKQEFTSIKEIVHCLSPLSSNFHLIASENFLTVKLNKIKNDILVGRESMIKLGKIETLVSLQDNFISNIFVNSFLPFNMILFNIYLNYQKKSNVDITSSIESYTELETLFSLAILPQIKNDVCAPIYNNNLKVSFKDIKHPLIKEEVCVSNSFDTKPSVNIITGSNMSGKTSFLRTIGINLVLMYAGGMVNAKEFSADILNIYSSMRITDDIKNGISTFYRELLRIKGAIKDANDNINSIIFIDEVFRGTNSNDRISGAISLINNLKLDNVILFMTTHDFELCSIDGVNNYHFEEHYENDKIAFDYKLKDGRCETTNAVYLMKLVGIME